MQVLFSGQILQSVKTLINDSEQRDFWTKISFNLSRFYCKNNLISTQDNEKEHPIFSVIDNQLSRGLPTLSSITIERHFASILGLTQEKTSQIGAISFELMKPAPEYLRSLVLADVRTNELNTENTYQTWEDHGGSEIEKIFFENKFNEIFNKGNQLLQLQRTLTSILSGKVANQDLFYQQTLDFVLEFPQFDGYPNGLIIEIDGQQHSIEPQTTKDNLRNHATNEKGYQTVRIKTLEINNISETNKNQINQYLQHPYFQFFKQNISSPLWNQEADIDYLQLFLSPFGVARIQKVLIKALKKGIIDLTKDVINIAIIERDIPCAKLAIEDLLIQIEHLSLLQIGEKLILPKFNLSVYNTLEFNNCKLNSGSNSQLFSNDIDFRGYDLLIDVSVLNYSTFINKPTNSSPNKTIVIRSIHHTEQTRKFNFYPTISYRNVPVNRDDDRIIHLNYFLQSLFRKETFREGQVEILAKALEKKNPIALLPTGAGKSLTYQIASLLQPGLTIVVDPIKALMKDQNENLKSALIDGSVYINSTLSPQEKEQNIKKYSEGEFIFAFVSPERFVIENFRNAIASIPNFGRNFSYCVIDEAHCVSEWGHDFRTAYLKLGDNSRKFCFSGIVGENVSTLGLTGTASFDVLSDVQREVGLQHDSDIIRPEKLERKELTFKVKSVNAVLTGASTNWNIKTSVFNATKNALLNILRNDLLSDFDKETFEDFIRANGAKSNCGLIFCPHATRTEISVQKTAEYLRTQFPEIAHLIGEYHGQGSNLDEIQDAYKANKITLLVATKAFGMGIDKPNIRFTIHITHPISIEGFYQEAGRAGRDRNDAMCYILHCNNLKQQNGLAIPREIQESFLYNSFKGREYEKSITFDLLNKITFPHSKIKNQIEQEILEELGKEIKLGKPYPYFPATPHTIYINGEQFGQNYGSISINNLTCNTNRNNMLSEVEAVQFMQAIYHKIQTKKPVNIGLVNWLDITQKSEEQPGLELLLHNIPLGESQTVTIGLENDGIQRVTEYLQEYFPEIDNTLIQKAISFCKTDDDFIDNLIYNYRRVTNHSITLTSDQIVKLKNLYSKIRADQDTLKTIYRLSVLGVIEDYTIQYPSSVTVICKKLTDQDILNNLEAYVERYLTRISAQAVRVDVPKRNQATMLRKCIDYLIDFTYDKVFDKRKKALDNIEEAVIAGLNDSQGFIRTVNDYFDSQYVEELYKVTSGGDEFDFNILFSFIKKVDNDKNLQQQLRGSSNRLLESNPDNPVFSWLVYYTSVLLKDRQEKLQEYFKNGFQYYYNNGNGYSYQELDIALEKLGIEIKSHDIESFEMHENQIAIFQSQMTLEKMKSFNQKILQNYA